MESALEYLNHFQNKNIDGIKELLTDDAELHDWDIHEIGKEDTIKAFEVIFKTFDTIEVDIKNTIESRDKSHVSVEMMIKLQSEMTIEIKVVDLIQFEDGLIKSIRAYKQ